MQLYEDSFGLILEAAGALGWQDNGPSATDNESDWTPDAADALEEEAREFITETKGYSLTFIND